MNVVLRHKWNELYLSNSTNSELHHLFWTLWRQTVGSDRHWIIFIKFNRENSCKANAFFGNQLWVITRLPVIHIVHSTLVLSLDGIEKNYSFSFQALSLSASVFIAILSSVAMAGNSLIMATIWKTQSLRTPSYISCVVWLLPIFVQNSSRIRHMLQSISFV